MTNQEKEIRYQEIKMENQGKENNIGFEQLITDQSFVGQLQEAHSVDDVQNLCKQRGLELTTDEVKQLLDMMYSVTNEKELVEDELETVAGGFVATGVAIIGGVWAWAKECQNKESNTYKATRTVVDFWYNKGRSWGWWR